MVTSISLALGLIVGEAIVEIISGIFQAWNIQPIDELVEKHRDMVVI